MRCCVFAYTRLFLFFSLSSSLVSLVGGSLIWCVTAHRHKMRMRMHMYIIQWHVIKILSLNDVKHTYIFLRPSPSLSFAHTHSAYKHIRGRLLENGHLQIELSQIEMSIYMR